MVYKDKQAGGYSPGESDPQDNGRSILVSKEVLGLRSQIKLGRVFGIKIGLHYSWFLIALLIVFSLSSQFHATNPAWGDGVILAMAVGTAILFFVSLLLHELAHSLVATSNKLPVKEITLFALGGVSQIEKNPVSAKVEFWMAFVGPLTSAVDRGGLPDLGARDRRPVVQPVDGHAAVARIHQSHVWPLSTCCPDIPWMAAACCGRSSGGRPAMPTARRNSPPESARWWLSRSSRSGIFRFFGGAGIGGLWIAFIGWFLLQAARESYVQVGLAHALKGVRVADVMTRDCPTVDGWLNVQNFVEQELLRTGRRCFIVVDKGEITGLVTPHEIKQIDRAKWPFMTLHDIMRPLEDCAP